MIMNEAQSIPIVIIEDAPEIRKFLKTALTPRGYHPSFAETAREGLSLLTLHPPELIILDLGLPDMDGLEVIKNVREWSQVPIIVLSARGQEQDKITALESGADDYLTKPFSVGELLARLSVALRHSRLRNQQESPVFTYADLTVDLAKRHVFIGDEEIHLTPTEYKLLSTLVKHAGKVVTHCQLLKEVWGKYSTEQNHYLRIYMQHLRQKLHDDPLQPRYLLTETGIGYRLKSD
jgi:two-component system KDP operon response regulator KdpE